jgi:hypothetical protein
MIKLSASEVSTVTNALRVAADQYDEDVKGAIYQLSLGTPEQRPGLLRVQQEFERLARDARALIDRIELARDTAALIAFSEIP